MPTINPFISITLPIMQVPPHSRLRRPSRHLRLHPPLSLILTHTIELLLLLIHIRIIIFN